MVIRESHSPEETQGIAREIANQLTGSACIALSGDLGAGKTTFVRGLVDAWGGDVNQVSSPTYVLMNCYQTPRGPIFHLDAYRVRGPEDFEAIGFDEFVDQPGLVVMEWPEKITELLRPKTVHVTIAAQNQYARLLKIQGFSQEFENNQEKDE